MIEDDIELGSAIIVNVEWVDSNKESTDNDQDRI